MARPWKRRKREHSFVFPSTLLVVVKLFSDLNFSCLLFSPLFIYPKKTTTWRPSSNMRGLKLLKINKAEKLMPIYELQGFIFTWLLTLKFKKGEKPFLHVYIFFPSERRGEKKIRSSIKKRKPREIQKDTRDENFFPFSVLVPHLVVNNLNRLKATNEKLRFWGLEAHCCRFSSLLYTFNGLSPLPPNPSLFPMHMRYSKGSL